MGRLIILVASLSIALATCCSCNSDAGSTATTPVVKPDPSQLKQQGAGGVKARSGGGMAMEPEAAKPGEHVGAPPSGSKAGGG